MSQLVFGGADDVSQLAESTRAYVQDELESGEKIVWLGRPLPRRLAFQTLPVVLFGIPWTAFALFWTAGAAGFKLPNFQQPFDFFPLFGVPFVLVGVGLLSSPYWTARSAKRTAYVLTDRRAITFQGGMSMRIRSFRPSQLEWLTRVQRRDGSGDVIFLREPGANDARQSSDVGFLAVRDVKHVEMMVRKLAESPPSAPPTV